MDTLNTKVAVGVTLGAALALAVLLGGGCAGITREDRIANSIAVTKMKPGTVLTEGQVAALDQDQTYVCENKARTGSHIPHQVCRTLRRQDKEARDAQNSMTKMALQPHTNYDTTGVTGVSSQGGGGD